MIRQVVEDDIPRILEIEQEAISPPWTHGALLSEVYSSDTFFAVLEASGGTEKTAAVHTPQVWCTETVPASNSASHIIGFVILRRMADEGELFQIAVDASHRRRGLANKLMDAAIEWAHGCGVATVYLEVRESNKAAISLYKKHGFKQNGRRKEYYTDPVEDAVVMAQQIEERG